MSTMPMALPHAECKEIARLLSIAAEHGRGDQYSGKREQPRFSSSLQLEGALDTSAGAGPITITLHNISVNGIAFWVRQEVLPGTVFFVREFSNNNRCPWVEVCVTHCTQGIRGFVIGAEFRYPVPEDLRPRTHEEPPQEEADEEPGEPETSKGRGLLGWLGLTG